MQSNQLTFSFTLTSWPNKNKILEKMSPMVRVRRREVMEHGEMVSHFFFKRQKEE
jgi:hypothetical protein